MYRQPSPAALHSIAYGNGVPTLVLHGGLGWDHTYLRPGLDTLAGRQELIYVDLTGNGRSPEPARWEDVSHESWVDDVDAVRALTGHERIVLFGHSYGGFLALEYALKYPQHLHGLILCATLPDLACVPAALARAQARASTELFATLVAGLSTPIEDDAALGRFSQDILPLYFNNTPAGDMLRLFAAMQFRANAYNHAAFTCLPRYNVTPRLREVRVPTLLLSGRHDWLAPPEDGADRMAPSLADAVSVVFERSGHFPFLEETEEFARTVDEWVSALVVGSHDAAAD